ncbi:heavy metal-associated isoprenylated plant protein 16 [Nicotiana tabacum]|uniref:Heavy metal-associated isoprenylated plant protein 16 n=2 Tax=Nicotiana TaxID=4085 RepID=A0A1S4AJQ4_TOBAC|nr:heavy metal-associated isoprenylated plant protein 16-like [Nicotiana tomentosiformis]XP_016476844.1 PREDICTED: uncharacterized protein LOC107798384 [Nicotiana tabacum]
MKQKVVIKLSLNGNDQKYRSKAFKIAVSQPGVESAAMKGEEKNQLEVVGDEIDAVTLTNLLRKNLGQAQLVSVGPASTGGGENKDKAGSDTKPQASAAAVTQWQTPYYYTLPQYPVYQVRDSYDDQPVCSIM